MDGLTGEEISIHAPREGSDWAGILRMKGYAIFLSTLPARGATIGKPALLEQTAEISIHAPREGSDMPLPVRPAAPQPFLSTLPARGATARPAAASTSLMISIHAPREGSDRRPPLPHPIRCWISIHAPREGSDHRRADCGQSAGHFYPRSPRGERPASRPCWSKQQKFLSTLPARGATHSPIKEATIVHISIHAPREGSDRTKFRSPWESTISIHAPREGSDLFLGALIAVFHDFYPRSPRGERPRATLLVASKK